MAVNKVVFGSATLVDLTDTTATADKIAKGFGAYGADGQWMDGTADAGGLDTSDGTIAPNTVLQGYVGYAKGERILGTYVSRAHGDIEKVVVDEITVSSDFTTTPQTFQHRLGVTPDMVIVWAVGNIAQTYSMLFAMRSNQMGYRSSAYNSYMGYHGNSTTTVSLINSSSTSYGVGSFTASSFKLASANSSYYWRKGTYRYLAIKFA